MSLYRLLELINPNLADNFAWMEMASCKGLTDLFFPDAGEGDVVLEALAVCRTCPVMKECQDYALDPDTGRYERFGIWGGLSLRDRRMAARTTGLRDHGLTAATTNANRHRDTPGPSAVYSSQQHDNASRIENPA